MTRNELLAAFGPARSIVVRSSSGTRYHLDRVVVEHADADDPDALVYAFPVKARRTLRGGRRGQGLRWLRIRNLNVNEGEQA